MTAREPSAVEVLTEALLNEGGAPGSSLHSWRCEYPDRYGECDCVPQTAQELLAALKAAGFVVATRDEIAEVWDEGYDAGSADESFWSRGLSTDPDADEHPHSNPYREVQP